jgi:uncharacterized protein (TIRG00374 family)
MKRLLSLSISLLILAFIYWRIDLGALLRALLDCDGAWLILSLGMVVPLTVITAWRFQRLMPPGIRVKFTDAISLILAASSLNMVLPSKLGDIAKSYFMKQKGRMDGNMALSLVVFEKSCDMLSLLLWCTFGLILYPDKGGVFWVFTGGILAALTAGLLFLGSSRFLRGTTTLFQAAAPPRIRLKIDSLSDSFGQVQAFLFGNKTQAFTVATVSMFLWFLHLVQIWFFILALKTWVPFLTNLAIAPLAILAGLIPLTFAGVGTRDAAVILLYRPFFDPSFGAALGLLYTSRYLLPALGGLPFLSRYLAEFQDPLKARQQY